MRNEAAEVAPNDAVPGRPLALIELPTLASCIRSRQSCMFASRCLWDAFRVLK